MVVAGQDVRLQQQINKFKDAKEIVEESFSKDGAVATARYVGVIDGPLDKVQAAVWQVEKSSEMMENIKKSELIKSEGNTKTVVTDRLPFRKAMQFTLDPANMWCRSRRYGAGRRSRRDLQTRGLAGWHAHASPGVEVDRQIAVQFRSR